VVTILAREGGTNFREVPFAQADIFLRAADRPYPSPIPTPQPGCDAPTADVQLSGLCAGGEIDAGTPIYALGGGSTAGDPTAVISTYIYDWGDGTGSDVTGSSTGSHVFDSSLVGRSVSVQLTVVNSCGASASATADDTEIVASCGAATTCPTPSASFSVSGLCGTNGNIFADGTNVTRFDGSGSSGGTGQNITSYSWSLGDGTSASGATATRQYPTTLDGLQIAVSLTVRNACGATDTDTQTFDVEMTCP
jgi:hypothetical protein